tara:strand:- start:29 stop:481 length:453 start_codon:yes stop_codon:yes gene_type:complete
MNNSTISLATVLIAVFFTSSLFAQNVAINNSKKSNNTETIDKKEKECTKTKKGFSFFSKKSKSDGCCKSETNKTAQKTSCDSKAQKTSCDSKAMKASNSLKTKQSCCSKTTTKASNRDAAAKVRQAIAKGEITPEQGNARLARLQKNNKK